MPPVTVIIVSYNVSSALEACLESLGRWVRPEDAAVTVVDNASSDDTVEMVRRRFPGARIVTNRDNVGFGRANNAGIRESDTPFLLLLNPDTVLTADPIGPFRRFLEAHPKAGMASCILLEEDGSPQRTTHVFPSYWTMFLHFLGAKRVLGSNIARGALKAAAPLLGRQLNSYMSSEEPLREAKQVETIPGAFMFCRREALEQAGLFDEDFFLYSEDIDLCRRVADKGWSIHLLPSSPVRHCGGKSMAAGCGRFSQVRYRGDFLYFKKHHALAPVLIPLVAVPALMLRAAVSLASAALDRGRRPDLVEDARSACKIAALSLRLRSL